MLLGRISQQFAVIIGIVFLSNVIPDSVGIFGVGKRIGSHCNLKAFLWRLGFAFRSNLFSVCNHLVNGRFFFGYSKPVAFGSHNLGKELFVLWGKLCVLLQKRNELLTPETQTFHLLSVIIFAFLFPLWDKRTVRG